MELATGMSGAGDINDHSDNQCMNDMRCANHVIAILSTCSLQLLSQELMDRLMCAWSVAALALGLVSRLFVKGPQHL